MEFLIIILIIIIFILSFYLFLLKKEIRGTTSQLQNIEREQSNTLLNKEFDDKDINQLTAEINVLLKSINERETSVYSKNNSLQTMITNIAHDLRTPLTSALGYIDIILNSDLSKEEEESELRIIEERLRKLEELINSFFEFSKIILNNENIKLEKINLIAVVEESVLNYYEDFAKDNRKIDLISNENKIDILSNKELLIRIFDNLIGNSYKHSNSDLRIELKVDSKLQIKFINRLLYPQLDTERMFDEFYTVDISRTKNNTGLGLAIAKEFAEQLNGKIYAIKRENMLEIIVEFQ